MRNAPSMTTASLTNEPSGNGITRNVEESQAISAPLRREFQAARNEAGLWRSAEGSNLYRSSEPVASARALWLGELAEALDEAQRLTALLGEWRPETREAATLRARIAAVRAELDALRRSGIGEVRREIDPSWTSLANWCGNLLDQPESLDHPKI